MKRGVLERNDDVSGVTGTGNVAEFVIASDGRVTIFWPTGVGVWPSLEEAIAVHGHNGKTLFTILDDPEVEDTTHCGYCHQDPYLHCTDHEVCPGCLEVI